MSDPQTPDFTVIDRRHGVQNAGASEVPVQFDIAAEADREVSTPGTDSEAIPGTEPIDFSDEGLNHAEKDTAEAEVPNAAMLFSFAAMQMELPDLLLSLTAVVDGHAWRALGMIAHPLTGVIQQDLPGAQNAIDTFQFLIGKVEGSVPDADRREMHRRLNDLRVNYLARLKG